jgi:hypothetical protein
VPRLHDQRFAAAHHDTLAGFEHMVVEVAGAGHPHAAARDHEFPRTARQLQRLAPAHREDSGLARVKLRFHHESPGSPAFVDVVAVLVIFGDNPNPIQ